MAPQAPQSHGPALLWEGLAPATARLRAREALAEAGCAETALEWVASNTNEVWFVGPYVLRVCPVAGTRRLSNEAAVMNRLPEGVPHARVVATGPSRLGEWLVSERLRGQPLSRAWPTMRETERQDAVHQVGRALRALHDLPPEGASAAPGFLSGDTLECPHQLPASRLLELLDRVGHLPHVDLALVEAARALVITTRGVLDDGPPSATIHGDLHFENLLWHQPRLTAVLDFEWTRPGPADLDLDVLLRFCADPGAHVAVDYKDRTHAADYRSVPRWLREVYPELFAHPRLNERLALYSLSYDVRDLLLHRPGSAEPELGVNHPLRRIRRLLEGRSHLPWLEW